jgi:sterol-4alpha-carboxylate 3-dehydrogenase (decarboxylating)
MSARNPPLGAVFVTGGCGLLGHHVVKYLLDNGSKPEDITVFDISTAKNRFPGVNYIAGDLSSKQDVASAFDIAKPNVIINTASPDAMTPNKEVFWRCNVTGVQNIIECAQERGIRILVHTSSSEVVQDGYKDLHFVTEDALVLENPVFGSVYAKTKVIGEKLVLEANRKKGLLTCAIRLTTLMGEGDVVITRHFMQLGRSGKIKFQIGSGKNKYDLVYAGNAAEGHVQAAHMLLRASESDHAIPENERVDGEAFNMSNGEPWLFWGAARFVSTVAGYPINEQDIWKVPMELLCFFMAIWEFFYWVVTLGGTPEVTRKMMRYIAQVRTFDITKARKRLGYNPKVSVEEGFRRAVEWHLAQEKEKPRLT